jgi:hypothetical protein
MTTQTDLDLILECLGKVLFSCQDRCVGGCNCYEMYDKAKAIVIEWNTIVNGAK